MDVPRSSSREALGMAGDSSQHFNDKAIGWPLKYDKSMKISRW